MKTVGLDSGSPESDTAAISPQWCRSASSPMPDCLMVRLSEAAVEKYTKRIKRTKPFELLRDFGYGCFTHANPDRQQDVRIDKTKDESDSGNSGNTDRCTAQPMTKHADLRGPPAD